MSGVHGVYLRLHDMMLRLAGMAVYVSVPAVKAHIALSDTIIPGTACAVPGIIALHLYHEAVVFRASVILFLSLWRILQVAVFVKHSVCYPQHYELGAAVQLVAYLLFSSSSFFMNSSVSTSPSFSHGYFSVSFLRIVFGFSLP